MGPMQSILINTKSMDKLCMWMVAYFDIFGVECIWKEIERFVDNKNIIKIFIESEPINIIQ